MASTTRRLLLRTQQCSCRILCHSPAKHTAQWQRRFGTTPSRRDEDGADSPASHVKSTRTSASSSYRLTLPEFPEKGKILSDEESAELKAARDAYRAAEPEYMLEDLETALDEQEAEASGSSKHAPIGLPFEFESDNDFEIEEDDRRKVSQGFWAEGEESMGADENYYGDDLPSTGHGELRKHRQLREYARLAAWELPMLSQLARPFEPPNSSAPFRFRYTSYLGEEHPAANKVVVEFSPQDMSLTPVQEAKMIKLAGARYNPSTLLIKLSCEKFDTQTQNKRFIGETIRDLLAEAKDGNDTFEDVPFDFRHHKPKRRFAFPKEWILTEERKMYLANKRTQMARIEDDRTYNGKLIDGKTIVETRLQLAEKATEPVMVSAPKGGGRNEFG